jgi:hypothetical protein
MGDTIEIDTEVFAMLNIEEYRFMTRSTPIVYQRDNDKYSHLDPKKNLCLQLHRDMFSLRLDIINDGVTEHGELYFITSNNRWPRSLSNHEYRVSGNLFKCVQEDTPTYVLIGDISE